MAVAPAALFINENIALMEENIRLKKENEDLKERIEFLHLMQEQDHKEFIEKMDQLQQDHMDEWYDMAQQIEYWKQRAEEHDPVKHISVLDYIEGRKINAAEERLLKDIFGKVGK